MRYLLQNAQLLSSGGVFRAADVLLSGGRIVSIGDRISCPADAVSIDLHKAVLFPGFVDVHVHLREPGFSYKETIRTGTLAAAHGGFAHVAAMPNLDPVPDCAAALDRPARDHRKGRARPRPSLRRHLRRRKRGAARGS
ncbi:MAG: amidohydrolase family protein [Oscillospiraceae bacterium]